MGLKKGEKRTWAAGMKRISERERLVTYTVKLLESQRAWLREQPNQAQLVRKLIKRAQLRIEQEEP